MNIKTSKSFIHARKILFQNKSFRDRILTLTNARREPLERVCVQTLSGLFNGFRREVSRSIREQGSSMPLSVSNLLPYREDTQATWRQGLTSPLLNAHQTGMDYYRDIWINGKGFSEASIITKLDDELLFDTSEAVLDAIRFRSQFIADQLTEPLFLQLEQTLQEGWENGESISKLVQRLQRIFSGTDRDNPYRLKTIARTEIGASEMAGQFFIADESITPFKTWLTALDEKRRTKPFNHAAAEGERVGLKDKFTRTGEPLNHPLDWSSSVGNIVNCRCVSNFEPE